MSLMIVDALGVGAAAAVAAWLWLEIRRLRRRVLESESGLAATQQVVQAQAASLAEGEARTAQLERALATLRERLRDLESRRADRPFDAAIDGARRGVDAARLADAYGLSHSEARLLSLVHGTRKSAANP